MRMPVTGISAMPRTGTSPVSNSTATTGTTPAPIGTATHHRLRLSVTRRPAVHTATPNIKAMNANVGANAWTTQPMSEETAASWTAARSPARTMWRDRPSEANAAMPAATASSRASTTPSVMLTGSSTRPL